MTQTFFHASPHTFDFPDYDAISANMTGNVNGFLGLWVAHKNDWVDRFGANVYEVQAQGESKNMNIRELFDLGGDPETFRSMRVQLLEEGCDILRITEMDGRSGMSVIINFDAIERFTLRTQPVDEEAFAPR